MADHEVINSRSRMFGKMYGFLICSSMEVLMEGNWTQNVTTRLREFEHTLLKAMKVPRQQMCYHNT